MRTWKNVLDLFVRSSIEIQIIMKYLKCLVIKPIVKNLKCLVIKPVIKFCSPKSGSRYLHNASVFKFGL